VTRAIAAKRMPVIRHTVSSTLGTMLMRVMASTDSGML
jgi:hypothetical protein